MEADSREEGLAFFKLENQPSAKDYLKLGYHKGTPSDGLTAFTFHKEKIIQLKYNSATEKFEVRRDGRELNLGAQIVSLATGAPIMVKQAKNGDHKVVGVLDEHLSPKFYQSRSH